MAQVTDSDSLASPQARIGAGDRPFDTGGADARREPLHIPLHILFLTGKRRDAERVAATLKTEGIEGKLVAVDNREAFEAALAGHLDLILADCATPDFNGRDGLTLARERRPELPFICVGNAIGQEALIDWLTHGAADYVLKTRLKRLAPAVRRALKEAHERQRLADEITAHEARLRSVTERQRDDQNLRDSEQRLASIVATAMDAIITIDHEQRIVLFNTAAEAMFGCKTAEAIGTHIERLIPEKFRTTHAQHIRQFLGDGATTRVMGRLLPLAGLRSNGEVFPIEAAISRTQAGDHPLATVVVRDISARRAAEVALQESEQRLRLALQIGRIGYFDWNFVGNGMHWSAEIAALYGFPAKGLETTYDFWRERIHPEDLAALEQNVQEALETGTFSAEWRVLWPDGSLHWLAGRAVVYRNAADQPERMLGVNIDISERKDAEERARRTAQHDPLTRLPNRALVYEFGEHLLSAMRRKGSRGACLFVDLDRFKPINDTYGHDVGDAVLQEVARRFIACVRGEDLVGRLGGDEFVAILFPIRDEADAGTIAQHLIERLGQPYLVNGIELQISISIGISLFPDDGATVETLIKRADAAMYAVKHGGRNGFRFFQDDLNAKSDDALRIENRQRKALEFGEFELFLQPVVDLATGKTVAAEALIRWPAMTLNPERIIQLAEKTGFMQQLGTWILQEACRLSRQWQERGLPAFPVSINLSPIQFLQTDFPQRLGEAMATSGLHAGDVTLEITERMLINNLDAALGMLQAIREMGIKVALDDFGTGCSSLSNLAKLPLDSVKLDQSFVRNLGRDQYSAIVAESVIALAASLGLKVVAEGVESSEALDFLKAHHCPQGQGFLFSRPLPAREFEHWSRQHMM